MVESWEIHQHTTWRKEVGSFPGGTDTNAILQYITADIWVETFNEHFQLLERKTASEWV
jgi:hypothetical protein